jgi:hypothetical protein
MGMSLPDPIEICLEELDDASDAEPYVRCVAVAGGCPGLCFSPTGEVLWRLNETALAEIWVSLDGRLMFFRKSPQGQVSLTRVERHLELPLGKPVIVLGGDEISVAGKHFRVHVHGMTTRVKPPERLKLRRARNLALAAAIAIGTLAPGCKQGCAPFIEIRTHPPAPMPLASTSASGSSTDAGTDSAASAGVANGAASDAGAPNAGRTRRVPATHMKGVRATPPIKIRNDPPFSL